MTEAVVVEDVEEAFVEIEVAIVETEVVEEAETLTVDHRAETREPLHAADHLLVASVTFTCPAVAVAEGEIAVMPHKNVVAHPRAAAPGHHLHVVPAARRR